MTQPAPTPSNFEWNHAALTPREDAMIRTLLDLSLGNATLFAMQGPSEHLTEADARAILQRVATEMAQRFPDLDIRCRS